MILTSAEYLSGGYWMDETRECYEAWYYTAKQPNKKFRAFTTLKEAITWAKRHRGKIRMVMGSDILFRVLDSEDVFAPPKPTPDAGRRVPQRQGGGSVKSEKVWIAVQQEQGGKYAAFVVEIGEGDNIFSKLAAYPNAFGNVFTTRKKAEQVAQCWNDSFRQQGKYLWDIPKG